MLEKKSSLALIPKARGIFAHLLTEQEFDELMHKRSGAQDAVAPARGSPGDVERRLARLERLVAAGAEAPPPPASKRRGRRNAADKP